MIERIIRINKIKFDEVVSLVGNEKIDWLGQILNELMENLQGEQVEQAKRSILLDAELEIKEDSNYRKVLLLEGAINVTYTDVCSKTAELIDQELNISLKSIFIEKYMGTQHELKDEISLFYEEEEWDLYFYEKNQVDLYPIIHEYIFLNRNPYPGTE